MIYQIRDYFVVYFCKLLGEKYSALFILWNKLEHYD